MVVEVTEVLPSKGGALQVLCHGAVSIRRVATRVRKRRAVSTLARCVPR